MRRNWTSPSGLAGPCGFKASARRLVSRSSAALPAATARSCSESCICESACLYDGVDPTPVPSTMLRQVPDSNPIDRLPRRPQRACCRPNALPTRRSVHQRARRQRRLQNTSLDMGSQRPARLTILLQSVLCACGLSLGIGLPNVGKSTLFNALTRNDVLAANHPFATIEPNVGWWAF